jgi:hypothetical protein
MRERFAPEHAQAADRLMYVNLMHLPALPYRLRLSATRPDLELVINILQRPHSFRASEDAVWLSGVVLTNTQWFPARCTVQTANRLILPGSQELISRRHQCSRPVRISHRNATE